MATETDLSHVCKCDCHEGKCMHCVPCCYTCKNCEHRIIKSKMKIHKETCYSFTILDEEK